MFFGFKYFFWCLPAFSDPDPRFSRADFLDLKKFSDIYLPFLIRIHNFFASKMQVLLVFILFWYLPAFPDSNPRFFLLKIASSLHFNTFPDSYRTSWSGSTFLFTSKSQIPSFQHFPQHSHPTPFSNFTPLCLEFRRAPSPKLIRHLQFSRLPN